MSATAANNLPVFISLKIKDVQLNTVLLGDAKAKLKGLPDKSVNEIVTSPPYWQLRDYGTAVWIGGDKDCDHVANPKATKVFGNAAFNENRPSRQKTKLPGYYKAICPKCGAKKMDLQIGQEKTPRQYIKRLVDVFRECWRVLTDDGVMWINIGDTYAGKGSAFGSKKSTLEGRKQSAVNGARRQPKRGKGIKDKDLIGIPWMLAFALREDGWWLRSDCIWGKPNPMPESVDDRPTKAHEYVFLLTKSANYFYDADAIKTPVKDDTVARYFRGLSSNHKNVNGAPGQPSHSMNQPRSNRNQLNVVDMFDGLIPGGADSNRKGDVEIAATYALNGTGIKGHSGNFNAAGELIGDGMANKRSVWQAETGAAEVWEWLFNNIPAATASAIWTQWLSEQAKKNTFWFFPARAFKGAHFATFPPELIVDCIKSGTSEHGCCAMCGKGYKRITEKKYKKHEKWYGSKSLTGRNSRGSAGTAYNEVISIKTIGWEKPCDCLTDEIKKPVVCDPFGGSGTTANVAEKLGRDWIMIDLSNEFTSMAKKRNAHEVGTLFKTNADNENERKSTPSPAQG